MKVPDNVRIAGHEIKIVYKDSLSSDGVPCVGLAYLSQDRIELARTIEGVPLSKDQLATAFLHEALHIISTLHNLSLNEKKITSLELALYQFLHDNKIRF
jgi:hypothetical protein